jgi:hypothetical protein
MFHSKYYVPFSAHSASAAVIIHGYDSFIFFRIVVWHFPKEQLTIRCSISATVHAPLQWDAIYPAHVSNLLSSSKAGISPTASSWARNDCRSILVHAYQSPSLASITRRKLCEDGWVIHPEMQKRLLDTNPIFFRDMVATFLEVNGRGYWETSEENLERLQELYLYRGRWLHIEGVWIARRSTLCTPIIVKRNHIIVAQPILRMVLGTGQQRL